MTEAGTADRGSGLGHIPALRLALSQKIVAECLLCVIERAAATERQTVSQSTSASECVKRPMSSKLAPRFFLPTERDQDSFKVSYLVPRSSSSPAPKAARPLASSTSP